MGFDLDLLAVLVLLRKLPERAEEAVAGVEGMDQDGEGIDLWLLLYGVANGRYSM